MAKSPAHKLGQIIGDALEATIDPILTAFSREHGLFLDRKGKRPTRKGVKLSWKDRYENSHDLDFVIERGANKETTGVPLAFIEIAWRRYTKHSRNKAQEIQGAVLPLRDTHHKHCPFIGVVLAGEFTAASLTQLRSLGFSVVYFSYESVLQAFAVSGVDVSSDEKTTLKAFREKIAAWEKLSAEDKQVVYTKLAQMNQKELANFMQQLADTVNRKIDVIRILPLYGRTFEQASIGDAIKFLEDFEPSPHEAPICRFEIQVRFANGDKILAEFASKGSAIEFLKNQHLAPEGEGAALVKQAVEGKL